MFSNQAYCKLLDLEPDQLIRPLELGPGQVRPLELGPVRRCHKASVPFHSHCRIRAILPLSLSCPC